MVEFVGAPQVDLDSTGVVLTLEDTADPEPGRLPIADLKALSNLAATAVQPGSLGSAAGANTEDFMLVSQHQAIVAGLVARLEALESNTGYDDYLVLLPGIVQPGIVVQ
jgi:hypothetical protein